MGRRKATQLPGPFVMRSAQMLESPAWRALNLNDRRALERLELEHLKQGARRNGRLICTTEDFIEHGVSNRNSVARAIRRLEALGFIEVTRKGFANDTLQRAPSHYRLTYIQGRDDQRLGEYIRAPEVTNDWQRLATEDDVRKALDRVERAPCKSARPHAAARKGGVSERAIAAANTDAPCRSASNE